MAITLDQIAAPGSTPIAYNATSAKTFASDYSKVADGKLTPKQRKHIQILGLIYKLTNAGGANYKLNHAGLRQDAEVYSGAISNLDLNTAMCVLDWNSGNVADATLSTDVFTLLADGPRFETWAEPELDRIIVFLRAQMRT